MFELLDLQNRSLRIEECSTMKELSNNVGAYGNIKIPSYHRSNFYKGIRIQIPRKNKIDIDRSLMIVKIGPKIRYFFGPYDKLSVISGLSASLQHNGIIHCKHCRRILPEECQVVAFFNYLKE